jgi:hypothetical protein
MLEIFNRELDISIFIMLTIWYKIYILKTSIHITLELGYMLILDISVLYVGEEQNIQTIHLIIGIIIKWEVKLLYYVGRAIVKPTQKEKNGRNILMKLLNVYMEVNILLMPQQTCFIKNV